MKIGIYCTSTRPHLWSRLCASLSHNDVDWNLCITGPCPPNGDLPENVKYIQTNVKPPQCNFIAANNTEGDYIMYVTDDLWFSNNALDNMIQIAIQQPKSMVGIIYPSNFLIPTTRPIDPPHLFITEFPWKTSTLTAQTVTLSFPFPLFPLMSREDFNNIGIDKNFIGALWDIDMVFEHISRGGTTKIYDKGFVYDIANHLGDLAFSVGDHTKLVDMWFKDNKLTSKRKVNIDPIIYNDTVLTVSQGPSLNCWH